MQILSWSWIQCIYVWSSTRNIKGFILKSVENFRYSVTYIHRPTLARHVGTSISFHNWWKSKVAPNDAVVAESSSKKTSSKKTQPTVIQSFMVSNTDHYTKLFHSALFLLEEELAFIKLKPIVELQKNNGLPIMSVNKVNDKACAEFLRLSW